MLNRPSKAYSINLIASTNSSSSAEFTTQHGLLSVPAENLAHITAYLDPPSLYALSLVSKTLYEHVKEDYTWHRAFLLRFLSILPESDIHSEKALVLRRTESSWRKEYVVRFHLTRRWERSRNTTTAHAPVHSSISRMHLMQSNSLISSSDQYGIVARSVPLIGKVIKGFLSPSPSGTGLGIGNPNTEFSPNVTACALTSDGGTAKIVWGFRNGEIAVMTAAKTMEMGTRSAARLVRCKVNEEHEAEVTRIEWDNTGSFVVSASRDGRIKVWDAKKVRCVWTSQYFLPDSCVFLALRSSPEGCMLLSLMNSGDTWIWFPIALTEEDSVSLSSETGSPNVRIPSPIRDDHTSPTPTSLHVDNNPSSSGITHAFVTYRSRPEFWGIMFENTSSTYRVSKYYSDETPGAVTALFPCLCDGDLPDEHSFVIAGHQMGWVTVYPQTKFPISTNINDVPRISPTRKFEAHPDGSAVTALAWNTIVLVTGSDTGDTSIFDACSFSRLRVLKSPLSPSRIRNIAVGAQGQAVFAGVTQILLGKERDFLVVSVGDRVMAFKADVLPKYGKKKNNAKVPGKRKAIRTVKGYEKILVEQLINESLEEHDEKSQYLRKVYGREREHRANLDRLGLDEAEALEYVLMLSRDEALERDGVSQGASQHDGLSSVMDDGVFEGDFDDIPAAAMPSSSHIPAALVKHEGSLLPHKTSKSSLESTGMLQTQRSKSLPMQGPSNRAPSSTSNRTIQFHPHERIEPRERAFGEDSVSSSFASSISSSFRSAVSTPVTDENLFPSISPSRDTLSPPRLSPSPSSSVGSATAKGAWMKPLASSIASTGGSPTISPNLQTQASGSSPFAYGRGAGDLVLEDMDEDMKLAIQLSLESAQDEARRRGDIVT